MWVLVPHYRGYGWWDLSSPHWFPSLTRGSLPGFTFRSLVTISHLSLWHANPDSSRSFSVAISISNCWLRQYLDSLYLPNIYLNLLWDALLGHLKVEISKKTLDDGIFFIGWWDLSWVACILKMTRCCVWGVLHQSYQWGRWVWAFPPKSLRGPKMVPQTISGTPIFMGSGPPMNGRPQLWDALWGHLRIDFGGSLRCALKICPCVTLAFEALLFDAIFIQGQNMPMSMHVPIKIGGGLQVFGP